MEDYVDVLIADLKVVASVPNGGRLSVRRGRLSVESAIHAQCVSRFWYGDSRDSTLQHVKNTVAGAVRTADGIMAGPGEPDWKAVWTLERLSCEMERSEAGLRNLRSTYASDSGMTAALQVVSERLQAHVGVIQRYIRGEPDKVEACM